MVINKNYIKEKLDNYLEFDSDILFNIKENNPLIHIFGGSIRDIIADKEINDIDILVGTQTYPYLKKVIEQQGYILMEKLTGKDIQNLYSNVKVISEPFTFIKGNKIIQLIRPRNQSRKSYKENFINLLQNVDISCCAVSYDGKNIYQNYPNAINHCLNLCYTRNKVALMYSHDRAILRMDKLDRRGWTEVSEKKSINRDLKINELLNNRIVEYKNELEDLLPF